MKTSRKQLHEWHWLLSLFNTHPNLIILGFIQTPVNYWSPCMLITEQIWGKRKSKLVSSWQREAEREKEREKDTIRGGHGKEKDNYSQRVVQNCTTLRSLIRLKKESCSIFAYIIKSIQWVRSAVHTNNINYSHRWNFKDLELEKNSGRTTKPYVCCAVSSCFVWSLMVRLYDVTPCAILGEVKLWNINSYLWLTLLSHSRFLSEPQFSDTCS